MLKKFLLAFLYLRLLSVAFGAEVPVSVPATTNQPASSALNALETKFKNTLDNCTFDGRWCLIEKGKMTEEYNEKYTILGARKSGKDAWVIYARIQYAGKDLTVPVPVHLRWAGETPIITLEKVKIPMLGSYSARVLLYDNTYAGVWSASDHGGMLHGTIERNKTAAKR